MNSQLQGATERADLGGDSIKTDADTDFNSEGMNAIRISERTVHHLFRALLVLSALECAIEVVITIMIAKTLIARSVVMIKWSFPGRSDSNRKTPNPRSQSIRVARLQNEIAPDFSKSIWRTVWNMQKIIQKSDPKRAREKFRPSSAADSFLTSTSLRVFHRPKFEKQNHR